jgi:hypothetical protein
MRIIQLYGRCLFFNQSIKSSSVLLVNGAWDGINALIVSASAYFIFGERFHHYSQYVGLLWVFNTIT